MTPMADRLWARAERMPNGCLEWQGARVDGYGRIRRGRAGEGMIGTHRAAWEVTHGSIPNGLCVLHACDNPPCCDPEHLFLGTNTDNIADRMAKGRSLSGEAHHNTRLSDAEIALMRRLGSKGATGRQLAEMFGCSPSHANNVVRGKSRAA